MKTLLTRNQIPLRFWWTFLFSAAFLILLGIYVLVYPSIRFAAFSLCFSAVFFLNGFIEIVFSVTNRKNINGWAWYLTGGIADLIIAGIFIVNPVMAAASLPLLVGIWLLIRSLLIISRGFELKQRGLAKWQWLFFFGLAGFVFSWINIYNPIFATKVVELWTGLALFTAGLFYLCYCLFIRNLTHTVNLHANYSEHKTETKSNRL